MNDTQRRIIGLLLDTKQPTSITHEHDFARLRWEAETVRVDVLIDGVGRYVDFQVQVLGWRTVDGLYSWVQTDYANHAAESDNLLVDVLKDALKNMEELK